MPPISVVQRLWEKRGNLFGKDNFCGAATKNKGEKGTTEQLRSTACQSDCWCFLPETSSQCNRHGVDFKDLPEDFLDGNMWLLTKPKGVTTSAISDDSDYALHVQNLGSQSPGLPLFPLLLGHKGNPQRTLLRHVRGTAS